MCRVDGEFDAAISRGEYVVYYDSSEAFPGIIGDDESWASVRRPVGQVCVCVCGVLFTICCIGGTFDDTWNREPILETAFWLTMSVLTCYGVIALAIRHLRIPRLAAFWKFFAVALPFLTYLGVAWEIHTQPALPPVEFIAVLTIFVIVTTLGLVFNWMPLDRMSRTFHKLRYQCRAHGVRLANVSQPERRLSVPADG